MIVRRRHFQLLELLIAIFLVVACAMPILQAYLAMGKVQFESARLNQRDHFAHLIKAKLVEQLYQRAIPWEDISRGRVEKISQIEGLEELAEHLQKLSFEGSYQLVDHQNVYKDKEIYKHLLDLTIILKDLRLVDTVMSSASYKYLIYVERNGEDPNKDPNADFIDENDNG